jgi:large subunit ribosomal protein L30
MANLKITLKKSLIGRSKDQLATVEALGLRKIQQTVVKQDNDAIRGMLEKVKHLVDISEEA